MQKDDLIYLGHVLEMAHKARAAVEGKSRADFDADETLQAALTHWLQVIGEAARHVSGAFQATHPEIPWSLMIGMRHKIVHDYMDVDEDVVWRTVMEDLPELIAGLDRLLSDELPDGA